jgi:hypothetical protein
MLLEASIDLDRVPEEYVISAAYDSRLQVGAPGVGVGWGGVGWGRVGWGGVGWGGVGWGGVGGGVPGVQVRCRRLRVEGVWEVKKKPQGVLAHLERPAPPRRAAPPQALREQKDAVEAEIEKIAQVGGVCTRPPLLRLPALP